MLENNNYFEKRIANETWKTYNSLEEKNIELLKRYKEAADEINKELYRAAEELKTSTPSLSQMYRNNRLKKLKSGIESIVNELSQRTEKQGLSNMEKGVRDVSKNISAALNYGFYETDKALTMRLANTKWRGEDFSSRLWKNTEKLEKNLNNIIFHGLHQGNTVVQMAIALDGAMHKGFNAANRLIRTETMHCLNNAALERYREAGIEQVEICAAQDERTCEICGSKHEKRYKLENCPAMPFHANCRCTVIPYIDMEEELQDGLDDGIIKTNGGLAGLMSLEYQRYGRNKQTLINSTYINSGEYRNKFDKITDNKDVSRVLYSKAKEMLNHRSGTLIEDMYWIDGDTGKVICCALNENSEESITYTNFILKSIEDKRNIFTLHTHPNSMPPSIDDFNSVYSHGYRIGLVICHDGTVYAYTSEKHIRNELYNAYVQEFFSYVHDEKEAQLKALAKLKKSYSIDFWEVK